MLKKTCLAGLVAIASLLPATASANNFNYNFLEVRTALSPESFGGEFSTFFTENSHFVGRADSRFEGDWDLAGGIGFNGPINQLPISMARCCFTAFVVTAMKTIKPKPIWKSTSAHVSG